jgi:ABC-2 type transport system ATP-binding protein
MTTSDTAVRVRGLTRTYGETRAVDALDLDIHYGEVFALLGPNGAGKTTTVEILEGFRRRDAGDVSVLGADPADADAAWRTRVGIVLQSSGGHDELTVAEVVGYFAGYYPDPRNPQDVIETVGLTEKRKTRLRHLSGGQRRRLDVALGILGRPELLFLDEPTTGFDPEARHEFWDLVQVLSAEGTTILLTTHYLDEAEHLAHRVGVIAQGSLLACDTPLELGGRQSAAATVTWWDADGPHSERTDQPTALVADLATRFGGEVPGLAVTRPSLEDVYLQLVGEPR